MQVECGQVNDPVGLAIAGPTVLVRIGLDPKYKAGAGEIPNLPGEDFHALVDTGASESCIDSEVADRLGLPVVEEIKMASALGEGTVNVYLAQIYIPQLKLILNGRFSGVHLHKTKLKHRALLGRTFLLRAHMVYTGKTGSVVISHT